MKKFLALVLALVMTMSLVTIAGAEDFTDAADVTYTEAVDVMTAVGVVGGYADGSFNPDGGLTRGAAAKIICNLILGPTTAEALAADAAPYSDVAVDNVFAGYIAFCQKEGIISGYADGTFRPAAPLTGYAFMKMLLGALGYDADIEGYTGANWSINVAKQALAIDLDAGLVGEFNGSKALTREEACLYAFNALNTLMVEYDSKSTISVGDIVINQTSDAKETKTLFRQKYFKGLTPDGDRDALGRPATSWYTSAKMTKASFVGTYADEADYVVVTEKAYGKENVAQLQKLMQDLTDNDDLFFVVGDTDLYVDGSVATVADIKDIDEAGVVYELFCEDDKDGDKVTSVAVLNYEIAKIEKVNTKLTKAQKELGATASIKLDGVAAILDVDFAGFDAETYVKDAYVLYVLNSDNEVIVSELAEVVEGEVTATKTGKVAIDGAWYAEVVEETIKHGTEGSFYLNKAGQVCEIVADVEKSDNYAYIYELDTKTTGVNADGYKTGSVTAYFVKADGTKGSAVVAADFVDTNDDDVADTFYYADTTTKVEADKLIAYTIEDGELVKAEPADKMDTASDTINKDNVKLGDEYVTVDTQFIFMDESTAGKMKVSTAVGYKNVDNASAKFYVYDDETGAVLFCFAVTKNTKVDSELYAIILDKTPVEDVNADDVAVNIYTVAIDGEETTLTVKASNDVLASKNAGAVISYEVTDGFVTSASYVTTGNVKAVYDDFPVLNDGTVLYYNDEAIWTITKEYDVNGDLETVTVSEDGTYDDEWNIFYTVEDTNKLTNAWIVETIK